MAIDTSIPGTGSEVISAPVRDNFKAISDLVAALEAALATKITAAQALAAAPIQSVVAGPNITVGVDGGVVTISAAGGGEGGTFDHAQLTNRGGADAHPQEAITGLVGALSSKAAAVHTHAIANVTGLQTALDTKTTTSQAASAAPVQSVAGKTGAVALAKSDVGLSNADNTADSAKPVSSAQQSALNAKVSIHAHNTAANLSIAVVSALPASPATNVLYIVTSGA